jgi:hypothetical protein
MRIGPDKPDKPKPIRADYYGWQASLGWKFGIEEGKPAVVQDNFKTRAANCSRQDFPTDDICGRDIALIITDRNVLGDHPPAGVLDALDT